MGGIEMIAHHIGACAKLRYLRLVFGVRFFDIVSPRFPSELFEILLLGSYEEGVFSAFVHQHTISTNKYIRSATCAA